MKGRGAGSLRGHSKKVQAGLSHPQPVCSVEFVPRVGLLSARDLQMFSRWFIFPSVERVTHFHPQAPLTCKVPCHRLDRT